MLRHTVYTRQLQRIAHRISTVPTAVTPVTPCKRGWRLYTGGTCTHVESRSLHTVSTNFRKSVPISFSLSVHQCFRRQFSVTSTSNTTAAQPLSDHASPDDIEEPDQQRLDAAHAHDPIPIDDVPMQGLPQSENPTSGGLGSPFTTMELEALVTDLKAFQQATASAQQSVPNTEPPPITPTPIHGDVPFDSPASTPAPNSKHSTPPPARPFLASWSVKEVCSWYLQVEEQLHLPSGTPTSAAASSVPAVSSFVGLLQKHGIDGARLLAFTSDPVLIPLISPQLLSRILYLRGLDTYSHMFQPIGGDDTAHHADPNMRHLQDILHSTVKIFCTSTSPDFARPWAQLDQVDSTSSGFVISGRRILGNAHGATSATNIRVRKHGDATKYKATVSVISHESDLVLLEVESEKFWRDLQPLQFGHVPRLQDTVIVVGYPTGGDSICVTKGVVSRILVSNYVHSDESLLTCQIDAAINSGNSGGPVLLNGAVVGVAFQGVSNAQSVGYIIPIPVVMHFLMDLQLHGRYTAFPSFSGLNFQKLENDSLKKSLGLGEEETGIIVMSIPPLDPAYGILQKNDVLTHIDSIPVASDGTIFFRHGERISARYLPSSKFVGDSIKLRVVRNKKPLEVSFKLQAKKSLVPTHLYDVQPSYFILAGLVFTPLSRPYLVDTFGKSWVKRSPVDLVSKAYYGTLEHPDQQVVILSTILVNDVNTGYGASFHNIELVSVNERKIRNLKQLVEIVEEEKKAGAQFLRFDFTLNRLIILETDLAFASTATILDENNIEFNRSEDLRPDGWDHETEKEETQEAQTEPVVSQPAAENK